MGKVYSLITRPIRTFNIENRVGRVISKPKPDAAPQYPSVETQKELVNKFYPDLLETQKKKDIRLDDYLKNVYVKSNDPEVKAKTDTEELTKPLPHDKYSPPSFELGFYETDVIPEGKCSLRQALTFMSKHAEDSTKYSAEVIALEYKLDKQVTANILKHFRIPKRMGMPQKSKELETMKKRNN